MSNIVDTNGWHTVAAVSYDHVNAAIAAQKTSPATWSFSVPDGSASVTNGTFGTWALITGGGNQNVKIGIPLTGGTLTLSGTQASIPVCVAPVMVKMNFLPQPNQTVELRVQAGTQAGTDVASVDNIEPPPFPNNFLMNEALRGLLQLWLNANLQEFNTLFASVNLDAEFADKGMAWLRPSWYGYAVAEPANNPPLQSCVFAVMCMLGDTPVHPNDYQVSPYAIPAGADAGFLIAAQQFLQYMILPAMPLMFKGIKDQKPTDNFTIDNDGTRIRSNRDLTMDDFRMPDGTTVTDASVGAGQFTLQVDGTELEITSNGIAFSLPFLGIPGGFDVQLNYSGRHTVSLDAVHDILTLTSTVQSGSGSVQQSKGLEIFQIAVSVAAAVTAIVSAGAGAVTKVATAAVVGATEAAITAAEAVGEDAPAAAEITVTCLRGLISGSAVEVSNIGARFATVAKVCAIAAFSLTTIAVIEPIVKAIADGNYTGCPKISDLTSNAVGKAVIWPTGVPEFTLVSAQLNGALQFGLKAKV